MAAHRDLVESFGEIKKSYLASTQPAVNSYVEFIKRKSPSEVSDAAWVGKILGEEEAMFAANSNMEAILAVYLKNRRSVWARDQVQRHFKQLYDTSQKLPEKFIVSILNADIQIPGKFDEELLQEWKELEKRQYINEEKTLVEDWFVEGKNILMAQLSIFADDSLKNLVNQSLAKENEQKNFDEIVAIAEGIVKEKWDEKKKEYQKNQHWDSRYSELFDHTKAQIANALAKTYRENGYKPVTKQIDKPVIPLPPTPKPATTQEGSNGDTNAQREDGGGSKNGGGGRSGGEGESGGGGRSEGEGEGESGGGGGGGGFDFFCKMEPQSSWLICLILMGISSSIGYYIGVRRKI